MADMPDFDLQSHSVHSDGTLSPAAVVERAVEAGVKLLALSDHDTVDGVDEALAAASGTALRVVPAVEITAVDSDHEDIHLLGYGIDHRDPGLGDRLRGAREERERRGRLMAGRLEAAGWSVDTALLDRVAASGATVGRPHVAEAVFADPANAQRLEERGFGDPGELIGALLVPEGEGWVPREHPTVEEAIGWVHDAGGLSVFAHPFFPQGRHGEAVIEAAVRRYAAFGLDGVEAFYVTHDAGQTRFLARLAGELGLLTTGSADFHGPDHEHFNRFRVFELHGIEPNLGRLAPA